jgi:hypothetical protein
MAASGVTRRRKRASSLRPSSRLPSATSSSKGVLRAPMVSVRPKLVSQALALSDSRE